MEHFEIVEILKDLAPYPCDHEIGMEFYEDGFGDLIQGCEDHVMIYPICDGFFHSHPQNSVPQFSEGDMDLIFENNMGYAYLGFKDNLYFLKITKSLKEAYNWYQENKSYARFKFLEKKINRATKLVF